MTRSRWCGSLRRVRFERLGRVARVARSRTSFLQSRDGRPLDRFFPELHDTLLARLPKNCVIDGEIGTSISSLAWSLSKRRAGFVPQAATLLRKKSPGFSTVMTWICSLETPNSPSRGGSLRALNSIPSGGSRFSLQSRVSAGSSASRRTLNHSRGKSYWQSRRQRSP